MMDYEGSPVLVMEVVEGETLDERLSRGPLPLKVALELAIPIAEALEAAHEKGILHRDLKPSNVKLTPEGGVKVLDFGLAKIFEPDGSQESFVTLPKPAERTDTGIAVGTAPYMSPEQARGEPVNRRTAPFFSPDGRWIAFGARGQLKKIDLKSDAVVGLADATPAFRGGSWGADGTIIFSSGAGGLFRVSSEGGEVREVTRVDPGRKELTHRWPQILPGGTSALFDVTYEDFRHDVAVANLDTGEKRILVENAGCPKYVSGHVLFGRDGIVYAAPFAVERSEPSRPPVRVLEGVFMWSSPGVSGSVGGDVYYDVTRNGDLLFSPREARLPKRMLVSMDRNGGRKPISESRRAYFAPLLSPDGRRIAVGVEGDGGSSSAMVVDIASDAWTLVGGVRDDSFPAAWMPDSERLLLTKSRGQGLAVAPLDGSSRPQTLYVGEAQAVTVIPDGSAVLFFNHRGAAQRDIWRLPLIGTGEAEPWLATESAESVPTISPDGQWVAYLSNDSGRSEIYVRAYSGSGGRHLVSNQGGGAPRWSHDGREIFFGIQRTLWTASVRTSPTFAADPPRKLFDLPEEIDSFWGVSVDGENFLMLELDPFELRPLDLVIVPDWLEEMKARLAAK